MLPGQTRWRTFRRRIGPLTRRVPGGHLLTGGATYARPWVPGLRRPPRRFVIFAQGRSGSTLLADLLNSHPEVVCDDEILTFRRHWPARYAHACSVGHRATAWGFKVKVYQLTQNQRMVHPGDFLHQLHDRGWKILHLQRRNLLRQALSSMVAELRGGLYHQPTAAGSGRATAAVHIDPDELVRRCRERERFVEEESRALDGLPYLHLRYEDDLLGPDDHQATADRVFTHLGVTPLPVATTLTKLAGSPLDGVANGAEVRRRLEDSPYAAYLDQD